MNPSLHILALLFAAATPQQTAPPPAAAAPATTTFHSDVLHLDYTYSSSLVSMGSAADQAIQAERDKADGATKKAIDCVSVPLTGIDSTNGFRMVILMRMDSTCLGVPLDSAQLPAITTSSLTQSMGRFGTPQMGTASAYKVAARDAAAISGFVKSEKLGLTFYGAASCAIQGTDVICWEVLSNDCTKLPDMMSYPVKFQDKAAEPVIPKSFAPPCN